MTDAERYSLACDVLAYVRLLERLGDRIRRVEPRDIDDRLAADNVGLQSALVQLVTLGSLLVDRLVDSRTDPGQAYAEIERWRSVASLAVDLALAPVAPR
jgi:hypothetical protein